MASSTVYPFDGQPIDFHVPNQATSNQVPFKASDNGNFNNTSEVDISYSYAYFCIYKKTGENKKVSKPSLRRIDKEEAKNV